MVRENIPAYFTTWSDEILSRANRVRALIGDRHWLSDGTYKEFLVREFLLRHSPRYLNICRGFIRHLELDAVSPEIDVLISDPTRHVPLFCEGDLQIVSPSSVLATFEVKSTYTSAVLRAALENVARARAAATWNSGGPTLWSAIVMISGDPSASSGGIVQDCKRVLADESYWNESRPSHWAGDDSHLLPSVISVFDQAIVLLDQNEGSRRITLRGFDAKELSAALAFAQLFAYLREVLASRRDSGELEGGVRNMEGIPVTTDFVDLPPR